MKVKNKSQLYSRRAFLEARKMAIADTRKAKIKLIPESKAVLIIFVFLLLLTVLASLYNSFSSVENVQINSHNNQAAETKKMVSENTGVEQKNRVDTIALVVYVSGAVKNPKILHLPAGARVADAIEKAGGGLPDADMENINLARKLSDGEQIIVRKKGQHREVGGTRLISINNAEPAELEKIRGVGTSLAQKIVDYRQTHGGFSRVEDLQKVPGIGPQKFANLRDQVQL